jgi:hypothetical protein
LIKNSTTLTTTSSISSSISTSSTSTISCFTCITPVYPTQEACLSNKPYWITCPSTCCPSCPMLQCVAVSGGWCWQCGWVSTISTI